MVALVLIGLTALLHAHIARFEIFAWTPRGQQNVAPCFSSFVLVAGIAAALTIAVRPGLVQTVPPALELLFVWLAARTLPQR
ncbi:hypothetical protein N9W17_03855 [Jannaschia sp.]|nr:hypothetical protein [Jannaschia sp.]